MKLITGRVRASPGAFILILLIFYEGGGVLLYAATAAALHELGHLAALAAFKAHAEHITFGITGINITYPASGLLAEDIAVSAAGPLASAAVSAVSAAMYKAFGGDGFAVFAGLNAVFCVFNLLPAAQMDGGRILFCVLTAVFGSEASEKIMCVVSCVIGGLSLIAGAYLMTVNGWNITLMAAGVLIILSYCKKR